jgi:hypothetical protein
VAKPSRSQRIAAELRKRNQTVSTFSLQDFCFDKQLAFIQDPARFKTAVCSRRSGKSVACAADLMATVTSLPGDVAYITLNRRNAKRIIWRELLKINKQYALGAAPDNTELTLSFPNGNVLHVSGAKDESEAEKFRGMALRKVYIDECQAFRPYIKDMIEDIIEPALTDYYGSLVLIGTPGPIPAGFFHATAHNPKWAHHAWTMQDNPHIRLKSGKDPLEIIKELAERRGLTLKSPGILREYFGQWEKDADSLIYHFNPGLNICESVPIEGLRYVFGIDIGWKDSDAIAVLGYSDSDQRVYLVEEYVQDKNDITTLANKIKELQKIYDPVKMMMDAGALGKKIQQEILTRHSLPVEAAEKTRKAEFIALMNDDLRTGKFKAMANSRFEEDSYLLQWDYSNPSRPVVSSIYHSDISDAALYAWRECKHFYEQQIKPPKPTANEYMAALEAKEAEEMERAKQNNDVYTDVQDYADLGLSDDYSDDF